MHSNGDFVAAVIMDELQSEFGFQYETLKASIDEAALGDRSAEPSKLVRLLANAKADAILNKHPLSEGYLLTCDQVHSFPSISLPCVMADCAHHHDLAAALPRVSLLLFL